MTHEEIVSSFIANHIDTARTELQVFAKISSPTEAIRRAALCVTARGKRHSHQYRIPAAVLEAAEVELQELRPKLSQAKTFDELFDIVSGTIGGIRGIGELAIYDIAERLGASFRLEPRYVYLHAGVRRGAEALGLKGTKLEMDQLPEAFQQLSASEAEDCLCLYKDELRGIASGGRGGGCRPRARRKRC